MAMNQGVRRFRYCAAALALFTVLLSCAPKPEPVLLPYIPPSYYACVSGNIDDLLRMYFSRSGNFDTSRQAYDGLCMVFAGIVIQQAMIVDGDTLRVSSAIFNALQSGAVSKLKAGDLIDIVGINRGPLPEVNGVPITSLFCDGRPLVGSMIDGWLLFTDCVFLPAGLVKLPGAGGGAMPALY